MLLYEPSGCNRQQVALTCLATIMCLLARQMEYGKDDRRPASRSRGEQPPPQPLEEEPVPRLVKGLQQVHLHNPPNIQDSSR